MGSINSILKPEYWRFESQGINKLDSDDILWKMVIGVSEDYHTYDIVVWISKVNYEKIRSGEYSIEVFPYSEIPILVFDKNNNIVPLVKNRDIELEKLSVAQQKLIKKYSLVKKL